MANAQRSLLRLSHNASCFIARETRTIICRRQLLSRVLFSSPKTLCSPSRTLFTSAPRYAAPVNQLSSEPTVVLQAPSPEYIEKEELDVELLRPEQVNLVITDRAAEVQLFCYHSIEKSTLNIFDII